MDLLSLCPQDPSVEKKIRWKVKRQCSRLPSVQEDPGGLLVGRDLLTVDLQSEESRNGVKGKVHVSHSLWKMQTRALQICNGVRASGKQMTEEVRGEPGCNMWQALAIIPENLLLLLEATGGLQPQGCAWSVLPPSREQRD